jgi:hypothetical protein
LLLASTCSAWRSLALKNAISIFSEPRIVTDTDGGLFFSKKKNSRRLATKNRMKKWGSNSYQESVRIHAGVFTVVRNLDFVLLALALVPTERPTNCSNSSPSSASGRPGHIAGARRPRTLGCPSLSVHPCPCTCDHPRASSCPGVFIDLRATATRALSRSHSRAATDRVQAERPNKKRAERCPGGTMCRRALERSPPTLSPMPWWSG